MLGGAARGKRQGCLLGHSVLSPQSSELDGVVDYHGEEEEREVEERIEVEVAGGPLGLLAQEADGVAEEVAAEAEREGDVEWAAGAGGEQEKGGGDHDNAVDE